MKSLFTNYWKVIPIVLLLIGLLLPGAVKADDNGDNGVVEVGSIAELLASLDDNAGATFTLTNEVVIFLTNTTRNQRYLADATGTLLVDDNGGVLNSDLTIGDGITGLTGTISFFNDSPQLVPSEDVGDASSTDNFISARQIDSFDELELTDRWDLVFIRNVSFQNEGDFADFTTYTVEDSDGNTTSFRTDRTSQWDSGFAGEPIPQGSVNILAYVGAFQGAPRLHAYFYDMIYDADVIGGFDLTGPANEASLVVEGLATTEVDITWDAPEGVGEDISYTWLAKVKGTEFYVPFLAIPSNDGGTDVTLTLNMGVLDAVLEDAGLNVGDEVTLEWTVFAEGNGGGNFADQTWDVTLERGVVDQPDFTIGNFALLTPDNDTELDVNQLPAATVTITWEEAVAEPETELLYTFHLDAPTGDFSNPVASIPANDGGTANALTLTYQAIDDLLAANEVSLASSINLIWTVTAEAGNVVAFADEAFAITFNRTGLALPTIGWANLQWPPNATVAEGDNFTAYGQVYAETFTEGDEASEDIQAWIGWSSEDVDPATWDADNWIVASFNESKGNNDEYMADLGAELAPGTYYYAFRYQLLENDFVYGGYNGGFWDGSDNVSGVLTVDERAATPEFSVAGGFYAEDFELEITSATEGATIYFTLDGEEPTTSSTEYTGPITISVADETVVNAIAVADGLANSFVATATYGGSVEVSSIAELLSVGEPDDGVVYTINSSTVITFSSTFRGRKVVVDQSGGLVMDDPGRILSQEFNRYDGFVGLTGSLSEFNGLIQFTPTQPVEATTSNNLVLPLRYAIPDLSNANQGELVIIQDVTFQETGEFANQQNYTIEDADGNTFRVRTDRVVESILDDGEETYIGTEIPQTPVTLVGYITTFNNPQLVIRKLGDIYDASAVSSFSLTSPADGAVVVLEGDEADTFDITWDAAAGNNITYRWWAQFEGNKLMRPAFSAVANNNGVANTLTLPIVVFDNLLAGLGVEEGEQLSFVWTIEATSPDGRSFAEQRHLVTFERGTITNTPNEDADLPTEVALSQNYPNPFNPTTQINYAIPVESQVTLTVYDVLGRQVATLINGNVSAGNHTVNFDGSRLASGLYIYRLEVGNQVFTRKMMLVK